MHVWGGGDGRLERSSPPAGVRDLLPLSCMPLEADHRLEVVDRNSLALLSDANKSGGGEAPVVTDCDGPEWGVEPRTGARRPVISGVSLATDERDGAGEGGVSNDAPVADDKLERLLERPIRSVRTTRPVAGLR